MPDPSTLMLFIAASLALIVIPGPAVLYIVTKSIDEGRQAGIVSMFGIAVGTLVHVGAAALGLSAILVTSATAFTVVKYLGAAYLIYLGVQKLVTHEPMRSHQSLPQGHLRNAFTQGVIVNVLNPKAAVFFFAFLPQFVNPAQGPVWLQVLGLGLIFFTLAVISDGSYALIAGQVGHLLRGNTRFHRAQRYVSGGTYIALGLATAAAGQGKK